MTHSFLTIAIPFQVGRSVEVERYLDALGTPLLDDHVSSTRADLRNRLDDTEIVHFMSITVVRGDDERTAEPRDEHQQFKPENSFIIIEASVDGGVDGAINAIAAAMDLEIRELLTQAGRPTNGTPLAAILERHRHDSGQDWFSTPGLNYDGTPGMTVHRIRQEAALAETIANMLQKRAAHGTALSALEDVRSKLWAAGEKWAFVPEPAPCLQPNQFSKSGMIWGFIKSATVNLLWPFFLILIAPLLIFLLSLTVPAVRLLWVHYLLITMWVTAGLLAIAAVAGGIGYALLRHRERTDVSDDLAPKADHVEKLMKRETFGAQNHLAASSIMKPGVLRRLTLRVGFWAAGSIAAYGSRPSFLGPTGVIHFARWIRLPGTNKLLFMSNYDGAWETYLEDFIEKAHHGVTGIWSNTQGFPKTEKLFLKGATDGDRLKRWTRRQQHPSWFWYVAYPKLSLAMIRTNAAIRQGIAAARTQSDAADWLSCFGSTPRPDNALQLEEISTLAFGGLRRLPFGMCMFVRLSGGQTAKAATSEAVQNNKKWLRSILGNISYGDQLFAQKAIVLGFAPSGLQKMGLSDEHLATFSVAFQHGNAAPWRARTLGDIGNDDPKYWLWGSGRNAASETDTMSLGTAAERQVDAVMLLYTRDPGELSVIEREQSAQLEALGGKVVFRIKFKELPHQEDGAPPRLPREPFGFLDGVSNPIIRGMRSRKEKDVTHVVDPGEFILGYPDNLGYMPPSPFVRSDQDPAGILPNLGADLSRERPDFSEPSSTGKHDLGVNGTFLVVRQLEQDTELFDVFLNSAVKELTSSGRLPAGLSVSPHEWIAAKMVGRWHDGTSLVRHPSAPGTWAVPGDPNRRNVSPDNDFSFRKEDPNGLRCPLGAHIRRANPRDSFVSGLEKRSEGATKEQVDQDFAEQINSELRIVNRHRIRRVGRSYEAQPGDLPEQRLDKPGLLFMCLNADIERQFEFVQQSWVLGPSFHSLPDEVDPLVGNRHGSETFSIPMPEGPLRINDIKDFVRVRGGGYFFLPGKSALRFLVSFETSKPRKSRDTNKERPQIQDVGGGGHH
jgi:deferrochelatase/peroxidase EfeB